MMSPLDVPSPNYPDHRPLPINFDRDPNNPTAAKKQKLTNENAKPIPIYASENAHVASDEYVDENTQNMDIMMINGVPKLNGFAILQNASTNNNGMPNAKPAQLLPFIASLVALPDVAKAVMFHISSFQVGNSFLRLETSAAPNGLFIGPNGQKIVVV
jgi:hypothetical protein